MKKKILILALTLLPLISVFSQTMVNSDGTPKYRGNFAIIVTGNSFTFQDGHFEKHLNDELMTTLKTSVRLLTLQQLQDHSFAIVNRDNEANDQVKKIIEENKLEDYLDGFSVQAKNQGADYLAAIDITIYGENNVALQIEISTRIISIANNFGFHYSYKSDPINPNNEAEMTKEAKKMIRDYQESLDQLLSEIFVEQYFIAEAKGKTLFLGAYQPNGKISNDNVFYAFRFKKESLQIGQQTAEIQVLEPVGIGKSPASADGGYLQLKSNKTIDNISDIVVIRNVSQPIFHGANQMLVTFFGLPYDTNSYEGFIKKKINNAVFTALTTHVGTQLIEHDHLPEIKKEKELQKSEDFLNGYVVDQMKSIGAQSLLKLEDFRMNGMQVSFKLSLISVALNQIMRSIDVITSIDNIEIEMYKQISERFGFPCRIKMLNKKTIEVASVLTLTDNTDIILELTKAIENPITGEVSYSRAKVCSLSLEEYRGNKSVMRIKEVFNKSDLSNLESLSAQGFVTYCIDASKMPSNISNKSAVQVKAEKAEKRAKRKSLWNSIKSAGKQVLKSVEFE